MNTDKALIQSALAHLDPNNDDHWTSDGLPKMSAVSSIVRDPSLMRKNVTDAAPDFTRDVARVRASEAPPEPPPESFVAPPPPAETEPEGELEPEPTFEDVVEPGPRPGLPAMTSCEDVLALPIPQVLGDPELTELAIEAFQIRIDRALKRKQDTEEELQQLNAKNEIAKRAAITHERNRKGQPRPTAIKQYLEAQNKARQERAKRAQRFIDAGTTQKDVAEALRPGSKLDASMQSRKPGLGSARPKARPLMTGS